jgi:hypothetical protein
MGITDKSDRSKAELAENNQCTTLKQNQEKQNKGTKRLFMRRETVTAKAYQGRHISTTVRPNPK